MKDLRMITALLFLFFGVLSCSDSCQPNTVIEYVYLRDTITTVDTVYVEQYSYNQAETKNQGGKYDGLLEELKQISTFEGRQSTFEVND